MVLQSEGYSRKHTLHLILALYVTSLCRQGQWSDVDILLRKGSEYMRCLDHGARVYIPRR